ncbi:MAG: copper resistance protein B [Candidatus Brevundimonas phytovorans]|nr:copper resistance protein B [Brevundimonas sp.]WEK58420.1 MAG: copper resistance protein B [Brevundimonas sp.]
MSRALSAAVAVLPLMLAAGSAVAQNHGGHGGHGAQAAPARPPQARPRPAPKPKPRVAAPRPSAPAAPVAADPHAGHDMSGMSMAPAQTPAVDPHAGHNMAPTQADPHAGHDMSAMIGGAPNIPTSVDAVGGRMVEASPPPAARAAPAHAADLLFDPAVMAASRKQLLVENGDVRTTAVLIDTLEARFGDGEKGYGWNAQGWTGGDINRFWWKTEGEGAFDGTLHDAEVQALYSRAVAPFWDVQAGVRQDFRPDGKDTTHLTVGVQGVAPYWFEMSAAAFLSTEGDLTARAEAEYDQRITQKWILQPAVEAAFSASDIPELEMGSGLTSVTAGLRLRYEIRKEFAPYVGVEWSRSFGDTADYARARGDDVDATRFVVGIKAWF